jgi:hypothetical protein
VEEIKKRLAIADNFISIILLPTDIKDGEITFIITRIKKYFTNLYCQLE